MLTAVCRCQTTPEASQTGNKQPMPSDAAGQFAFAGKSPDASQMPFDCKGLLRLTAVCKLPVPVRIHTNGACVQIRMV